MKVFRNVMYVVSTLLICLPFVVVLPMYLLAGVIAELLNADNWRKLL